MDGRVEKTENGDASGVEERKSKQVGDTLYASLQSLLPLSRCFRNSQSRNAAANVWAGFGTSTSTLLPEVNPRSLPRFPTNSTPCCTLCPSREQLEPNESGASNASTTDYRAVRSSLARITPKGMSRGVGYRYT